MEQFLNTLATLIHGIKIASFLAMTIALIVQFESLPFIVIQPSPPKPDIRECRFFSGSSISGTEPNQKRLNLLSKLNLNLKNNLNLHVQDCFVPRNDDSLI